MNVSAGDIAFTAGAPACNGIVVTVQHAGATDANLGPMWVIETMGSEFDMGDGRKRSVVLWPDSMLRRIGPGRGVQSPSRVIEFTC